MLDNPVFDRLPELQMPTLVVYGQHDALIPNKIINPGLTTEQVATEGVAQLPFGKLHLIPNCGHFVQWERSEEVKDQIRAFLQ